MMTNLDTLVKRGLVEKGFKDRRTNSYSITARGRREAKAHVRSWIDALNGDESV